MTTQTKQTHTKTPWTADKERIYADGKWIANLDCVGASTEAEVDANAEFIVKACNSHDELVEACQCLVKEWEHKSKTTGVSPSKAYMLAKQALKKAGE